MEATVMKNILPYSSVCCLLAMTILQFIAANYDFVAIFFPASFIYSIWFFFQILL